MNSDSHVSCRIDESWEDYKSIHGVVDCNCPKSVSCLRLNNSVLNKMPRDCTALPGTLVRIYSIRTSATWSFHDVQSRLTYRHAILMSSFKQQSRKSSSSQMRNLTKKSTSKKKLLKLRGARTPMGGAPVAISEDLQQFTRFSRGGSGDSLVMHSCAAIVEISNQVTIAQGAGLFSPGGNTSMSLQLNLTEPAGLTQTGTKQNLSYVSPVFDLIASAFVRYRVRSLKFHYEPQAAATLTDRLVFAFADDPMHPLLWNATIPTQASLLALSDSVAFAPWRSWSMDVTHRVQDQLFYTFTDPSTTVASFAERFSDFGVISCVTDGVSAGSTHQCGVLYMETIVELIEFCPISVTLPASRFLSKKFPERTEEQEYTVPKIAEIYK